MTLSVDVPYRCLLPLLMLLPVLLLLLPVLPLLLQVMLLVLCCGLLRCGM
jgi:hypothetical protein